MIASIFLQFFFSLCVTSEPPFNNPPGVDIWCGKAYRETNSSFDPGGWLNPPIATDRQLRLDLRIYPRYNLYLSSETTASLIIDTPVSTTRGSPFKNETFDEDSPNTKVPFKEMKVQIMTSQTNIILVPWTRIPVNSKGNELLFNLSSLGASLQHPWTIAMIGNSPDGIQSYYSQSPITILPDRNDTGSVARIDNLLRGIQVRSPLLTNNTWKTIFPFSFYTSWDWISSTINNASSPKNLSTFRGLGYNIIHPIPLGGDDPFNHTIFEEFLTICDELELYVMYDMRHTYQNNTSISAQLSLLQHHPSLLLYYTADEPDGACDPLNATKISYDHIKSIDPYHPVSLVLNCANFYFDRYTAGADIILEDTYPIAANTSFSTVYNTTCNTTYGDCGCDNCHANDPSFPAYTHNPFLDIIDRTENLYTYQEWLGYPAYKKPIWGVPQGFWDQGSFWGRWPTAKEEAVMGILRLNHGAKGIVAWSYPTSDEIEGITSSLARVVAGDEVARFTLGAKRIGGLEVVGGEGLVDAAAWIRDGEVLVSIVYLGYQDSAGVEVRLPEGVQEEVETLWGLGGWRRADEKGLTKNSVQGLETGVLKLKVTN